MRDRTPVRLSRQNEAALHAIAEAKHNSRSVKPTEHKKVKHGRQMEKPEPLWITPTPQASTKSMRKPQRQQKKNNMLKHYSTGNKTNCQRQPTPNRHRPRHATPGLQTFKPHNATPARQSFKPNSQPETVSILKKKGRRSNFATTALSHPISEAENVSIRVNKGRHPSSTSPSSRHNQGASVSSQNGQASLVQSRSLDGSAVLAKSVLTETRPVSSAPTLFNIQDLSTQMSNFFATFQNLTCTRTLRPDAETASVVPQPETPSEHAPVKDVEEEPGQLVTLGRSISLPFFGETQANTEETTVNRGVRSINLFPTIPEVRSEEEEDNIVRSLSFNAVEAAMNLKNSLGFESRTKQVVAESRDEDKVETQKGTESEPEGTKSRMDVDSTKKTEESHNTKKMASTKDVKKFEPQKVRKDGKEGTKSRAAFDDGKKTKEMHTKKKATSKDTKKVRKDGMKLNEKELDYSVLEIQQVTSLVIDLAREESTRREVSRHPARVVRVSSSKNDGWRKRLVGNKNPKSGNGSGSFASKKRIHV